MSGPAPWKCPACGTWLAPHVSEHRCDPPAAAVRVTSIDPPGSGGSFSAATLPGTVTTVNVHGSVVSEQDLARTIQSTLRRHAGSNWQRRVA